MSNTRKFIILACMAASANIGFAQRTITIKGKIAFPDTRFEVTVTAPKGFDTGTLKSVMPNEDGTYQISFPVEKPGVYTLDCQKSQRVQFWAEDEDLVINLRGRDTARVRYIGPVYAHIIGGPKNELMNMINWETYCNYWTGAAASNVPYRNKGVTDEILKQELSGSIREALGKDFAQRMEHIATYYGNQNSVLALLPYIQGNKPLYDKVIADFEKRDPNYPPLVAYKAEISEAKAIKATLEPGKPAPAFSYLTPDGKKKLGVADFKGKILVIDFWASWCGPCRAEIPHLKKAYAAYKDKGVEVLSVSVDKDEAAWRKAMGEENMPWPQVHTDDAGKAMMKAYQFSGIPHIVVIGKDGKIIGEGYRGAALMQKLEELTSGAAPKKPASVPMIGM